MECHNMLFRRGMPWNSPWPSYLQYKVSAATLHHLSLCIPSHSSKPEALLSLQSSAAAAFQERALTGASHAKLMWACEKEPACQRVLASTYGGCCFDDIMSLSTKKSTAWCASHCKFCSTVVPHSDGRILVDFIGYIWLPTLIQRLSTFMQPCHPTQHTSKEWTSGLEAR